MTRYRRIINKISTWYFIQHNWVDQHMINIWWISTSCPWNRWTINWKNKPVNQGYCPLIYLCKSEVLMLKSPRRIDRWISEISKPWSSLVALALLACLTVSSALTLLVVVVLIRFEPIEQRSLLANSNRYNRLKKSRRNHQEWSIRTSTWFHLALK